MATVVSTELNSTCSICLEKFKTPTELPCKHRFCTVCLHGYTSSEFARGKRLSCPLCRTVVDSVNSIPVFEESPMAECTNTANTARTQYCQSCQREDEQKVATKFCFECEENLCDDCSRYHRKSKATYKHNLSDISEFRKRQWKAGGEQEVQFKVSPRRCEKHSKKKFKYICLTHDAILCSKCTHLDHRQCSKVVRLSEYRKSKECTDATDRIYDTFEELDYNLDALLEHEQNGIASEDEMKTAFQAECTKLKVAIEVITSGVINTNLQNLHASLKNHKCDTNERIRGTSNLKSQIEESKQLFEHVNKHGTAEQQVIVLNEIQTPIQVFTKKVWTDLGNASSMNVQWSIDIDSVNDSISNSIRLETCRKKTPLYNQYPSKRLELLGPFNLEKKEKSICLRDITLLNENYIVFTDEINKAVRVFDLDAFSETSCTILKSEVWGVAKIGNNSLIVTLPRTSELCIVEMKDGGNTGHLNYIESKTCYFGVYAYNDNGHHFILASSQTTKSFDVLNMNGSKVNEIAFPTRFCHEQSRLPYVHDIAVNASATTIYASCTKIHKVIAMDFHGHVQFVYSHSELKTPLGIAVDALTGRIYLCSYDTHQIHEISNDGRFLNVKVSNNDGLNGPVAVAFDKQCTKLIVCEHDKGGEMKIFKIRNCKSVVDIPKSLIDTASLPVPGASPIAECTNTTETVQTQYCESCQREDEKKTATKFCFECDEKLCDDCARYHRKNRATRKHNVSDLTDLHQKQPVAQEEQREDFKVQLRRCEKHGNKKFKYICMPHDAILCSKCIIVEHRQCSKVLPLGEYIQSKEYAVEVNQLFDTYEDLDFNANVLLQYEKSIAQIVCQKEIELQPQCKKVKDAIEKATLEITTESQNTAKAIVQKSECDTGRQIHDTENLLMEFIKLKQLFEHVKRFGSHEQQVIVQREIHTTLQANEKKLITVIQNASSKTLKWTVNVDSVLEAIAKSIRVETSDVTCPVYRRSPMRRLELLPPVSLKTTKSSICLRECTVLDSGYVVFSDERNNILRVFNLGTCLEMPCIALESEPWGLAKLDPNRLIVALPQTGQLCGVGLKDGRLNGSNIYIKTYVYAWVDVYEYRGQKCIIASPTVTQSFDILNLAGSKIKTIKFPMYSHVTRGDLYINNIAVNNSDTTIYVSCIVTQQCIKSYKVVALDFNGNVKFVYTHSQLKVPMGIAVDLLNGHIYVCSYDTHQVHVIDNRGQLLRIRLSHKDGLNGPMAVAIDKQCQKFIVCEHDEGSEVKIFRERLTDLLTKK